MTWYASAYGCVPITARLEHLHASINISLQLPNSGSAIVRCDMLLLKIESSPMNSGHPRLQNHADIADRKGRRSL